jgi:hypothetical protein
MTNESLPTSVIRVFPEPEASQAPARPCRGPACGKLSLPVSDRLRCWKCGLRAVVTVLTPAYTSPGGNMFIDLLPVAAVVALTSGTSEEQFER